MAMSRGTADLSRSFLGDEVLTSSELIQRLVRAGHSEANARQVIRRHVEAAGVWRSSSLKLPRNERLFAPMSFRMKPAFLDAVGSKLGTVDRPGLARCLSVLNQRRVLHKTDVMRLLAVSPVTTGTREEPITRTYERELAGIRELGVAVVREGTPLESLSILDRRVRTDLPVKTACQSLRKELVFARVLIDRMREQNVLAWRQVEVPDPNAPYTVFNDQVFTASGFSYLSPLARWKEGAKSPTPCPALIDCYYDTCILAQVESFLQRIERVAHRGKSRQRVLGVIGAREFERRAFLKARNAGLWVVNFRQTFGDEALEVMAKIEELLGHVGSNADLARGEDQFSELSQLLEDARSNPIVATLRAIGFEALSGLILRSQGYENVELGRIVRWGDTTRDVDVLGIRGNELRIIECKAHARNKSVSPEEVKKFFTETVPACKDWIRSTHHRLTRCTAEIWTTGHKGKAAGDTLYRLQRGKTNTWRIRRITEIKPLLPQAISKRSLELLNSIAHGGVETRSDGYGKVSTFRQRQAYRPR